MHKGRRCPRFKQTWLTITAKPDTFAPERLNLGLFLFDGVFGFSITAGEYSSLGSVNTTDKEILWNGESQLVVPGDCTWVLTLSFDPLRGANKLVADVETPIGSLTVICPVEWFWDAWNDEAVADIDLWTLAGVTHTTGGTLTSRAKPWF